jgi:hypothetical protein
MLRNTSAKGRQGLKKLALLTLCAALIGGCAATSDPAGNAAADPQGSSAAAKVARQDPPPKVQNCAIVTLSTPVLYACNGKVYTEYQLQHLREKAEQVSSKQ